MDKEISAPVNLTETKKSKPTLKLCPTCHGRGFYEDACQDRSEEIEVIKSTQYHTLPKMKGSTKPQSRNNKITWKLSEVAFPILPNKTVTKSKQELITRNASASTMNERIPLRRDSSQLSKDSCDSLKDYTIEDKEIIDINEFLKITKVKLKSENLNDIAQGVINTVHIARKGSDFALPLMPQVNRHLCTLLKNFKNYYVFIAFEAIKELYTIVPLISRPEFDEMIHLLLVKVSDLKTNVREAANAVLDVVAQNTPPQYLVRAILGKGPKSKSPNVRHTSARLLDHVVDSIGPESLINAFNLREMRKNIVECSLLFLEDQNPDVRKVGKEIVTKLMAVPEFEETLPSDVPVQLFRRVEKILLNIKYEKQCVFDD
ncbi:hypothetical protein O3M35_001970 [Rhynocoris fuscipes]|uniref:CLASP N-terminal domain-containing protein n=1 Tax=Rhynocoris fuscipes TaxID=488301 RepID=A0AAW1CVZ1_9HEMI